MRRPAISTAALLLNILAGLLAFGSLLLNVAGAAAELDAYNFWGSIFAIVVFSPWIVTLLVGFGFQLAGFFARNWALTLTAGLLYLLSAALAYAVWYFFLPSIAVVMAAAFVERRSKA